MISGQRESEGDPSYLLFTSKVSLFISDLMRWLVFIANLQQLLDIDDSIYQQYCLISITQCLLDFCYRHQMFHIRSRTVSGSPLWHASFLKNKSSLHKAVFHNGHLSACPLITPRLDKGLAWKTIAQHIDFPSY